MDPDEVNRTVRNALRDVRQSQMRNESIRMACRSFMGDARSWTADRLVWYLAMKEGIVASPEEVTAILRNTPGVVEDPAFRLQTISDGDR